ncbi:MAG: WhiB family transcriptional regulator, redox-sensing transcriptional regulator [Actinomycetota bacterium]|nr:WhiB family transcriptional regulator, redox-sensing transcriptional regulator [Actinomycetota bacterium]
MQVKTTHRPPRRRSDVNWHELGACRDADPEMFFPESRASRVEELLAVRVCMGCPVMGACQEWALSAEERYGIWGGLTEKDRESILNRRAAAARCETKPVRRRRRPGRAA